MSYIGIPLNDPNHRIPNEAADDATSYNGCAQAAAASLVMYYKKPPYYRAGLSGAQVVENIYHDHPPDTPGGKLGTTPDTLEQICKAAGFPKTWRTASGPLLPGNDQQNYEKARSALLGTLKDKMMMIVLIDVAALLPGQPWLWHHYGIVYGFDNELIYLTNMPMVSGGRTI